MCRLEGSDYEKQRRQQCGVGRPSVLTSHGALGPRFSWCKSIAQHMSVGVGVGGVGILYLAIATAIHAP